MGRAHEPASLTRRSEELRRFLAAASPATQVSAAGGNVGSSLLWPKVSIVMPSYNQVEYIERSILSVLNQGYPGVELIVIDGGSDDGTAEIIRKYEDRLAYWSTAKDLGQSDALNKGFARVSGEICGWLNSDDLYAPGAIHLAAAALRASPGTQVCFGDWYEVDRADRVLSYNYAFDFNLLHFVYEGFHLNAQSMFWRKALHERFGEFDVDLARTMDYDLILRLGILAGEAGFLRLPLPIGCFRRHEAQKTQGFDARVSAEHVRIAAKNGFGDKFSAVGSIRRLMYRARRAGWYAHRGGASYCLGKATGL